MIPRKIHYCWLSGDRLPSRAFQCIESWRRELPDYKLVKWDNQRFDTHSIPFVSRAVSLKKWAFAADYIRVFALYREGGIYLDLDVLVKRSFDKFLLHDFFTCVEHHPSIVRSNASLKLLDNRGRPKEGVTMIPGIGLQAAVMGSAPRHPLLKDILDLYQERQLILADNALNNLELAPDIYARAARDYGFKYLDQRQQLSDGIMIYESDVVAGCPAYETRNAVAVHFCVGSWRDPDPRKSYVRSVRERGYLRLSKIDLLRRLLRKDRGIK